MTDELLAQQAELQKIVQHDEKRLKQAIQQLAFAVEKKVDLRHYISQYPYQFLLGSLLAGFGLAFIRSTKKK